ncbi:MAG TPA: hypothetical protein VG944_03100 [Fimbriimonas sp.]|nr:hypothetical protein [Fimbriimonas sp.]
MKQAATVGVWGERAQEAIRETVLHFCDSYGFDPRRLQTCCDPAQKGYLLLLIDRSYPFGQRERFPYKAWLRQRRIFKEWLLADPNAPTVLGGLFAEAQVRGKEVGNG